MSAGADFRSRRHKPRRDVEGRIDVIDCMTGRTVGRIGNLSESGMLLRVDTLLRPDALYQLRFELPGQGTGAGTIEVGVHVLWLDPARDGGPGHVLAWAGLHFIHVPTAHRKRLQAWVGQAS